jgi:von hippel-lindau disease tumour suppressor protein
MTEDSFKACLRSIESKQKVQFRLFNIIKRDVNIIWINYNGEPVIYKCLGYRQGIDINTYETHPWAFEDAQTKKRLAVFQGRISGYPETILMPKSTPSDPNYRQVILVCLPIDTLKDSCFYWLKKRKIDPLKLEVTEIPRILIKEYKCFYNNRYAF